MYIQYIQAGIRSTSVLNNLIVHTVLTIVPYCLGFVVKKYPDVIDVTMKSAMKTFDSRSTAVGRDWKMGEIIKDSINPIKDNSMS